MKYAISVPGNGLWLFDNGVPPMLSSAEIDRNGRYVSVTIAEISPSCDCEISIGSQKDFIND